MNLVDVNEAIKKLRIFPEMISLIFVLFKSI